VWQLYLFEAIHGMKKEAVIRTNRNRGNLRLMEHPDYTYRDFEHAKPFAAFRDQEAQVGSAR